MTEVMQWNGVERRDGSDRRHRDLPWHDDRRGSERRRGGFGVHHPNPTEALLRGIHAPAMLAFEPRAALERGSSAEPVSGVLHALAPEHEAHDAIPSTAAIAGHPLHPAVVPLPIGAFTGALAADVAYAATNDPFFARAARMLTLAGLVTGTLAAVLGGIDFWSKRQIRSHAIAWFHVLGNALVLGLGGISMVMRTDRGRRAVVPGGIALSAVSALVLLVTGWLGGELSYRHRVGMTEREADR
jgi:uncharacterized membrane protein